ncbi:helix-turn-helix domain-containing protein [Proteus sp. G4417]|uniref:helix-turn-helix domain-containing protein n=1 Tax=Proteus sp. G4417 TaxID=2698862 RepID=UPI001F3EBE31|nr:helix-turn-helix transcriptional regulator [Proteus sp. G4417]
MNNNIPNNYLEDISSRINQIDFLHRASMIMDLQSRLISDEIILDILAKINSILQTLTLKQNEHQGITHQTPVKSENKVASSGFPHPYLLLDTLAERLSRAMSLRDISQGELARKVGMSQPAIFKLVNGETKTSRKIVEIALALEVNPAWLQCGEGEMTDFCASKTEEL